MNRLLPRFAKSLRVCKVHPPDATSVAIALSGGPDSVALAALAARWHQDAAAGTVSHTPTSQSTCLPVLVG